MVGAEVSVPDHRIDHRKLPAGTSAHSCTHQAISCARYLSQPASSGVLQIREFLCQQYIQASRCRLDAGCHHFTASHIVLYFPADFIPCGYIQWESAGTSTFPLRFICHVFPTTCRWAHSPSQRNVAPVPASTAAFRNTCQRHKYFYYRAFQEGGDC